jgi:hypothetical protein
MAEVQGAFFWGGGEGCLAHCAHLNLNLAQREASGSMMRDT